MISGVLTQNTQTEHSGLSGIQVAGLDCAFPSSRERWHDSRPRDLIVSRRMFREDY